MPWGLHVAPCDRVRPGRGQKDELAEKLIFLPFLVPLRGLCGGLVRDLRTSVYVANWSGDGVVCGGGMEGGVVEHDRSC